MREIPLTQGQVALVDDEDFERINEYKWHAVFDRYMNSYYAARKSPPDADGKQRTIYMHREIMRAQPGEEVDHIYHNTVDQQKANLRLCSRDQNKANRRMLSTNTSGYKGVTWHEQREKWMAQVRANGKRKYLGLFTTALEAAIAYDEAAIKYQGKFARTNEMMKILPLG